MLYDKENRNFSNDRQSALYMFPNCFEKLGSPCKLCRFLYHILGIT